MFVITRISAYDQCLQNRFSFIGTSESKHETTTGQNEQKVRVYNDHKASIRLQFLTYALA